MIQFPGSPPFQPGPSSVDTSYGNGGITTVTQAPGVPMSNYDQLYALLARRMKPTAPRRPVSAGPVGKTARPTQARVINGGETQKAPQVSSWQSAQGAAMKPTGLGPQMIPGMAIDQNALPPSMRHKESQFQGASSGGGALSGQYGSGANIQAPAAQAGEGPSAEERWFQQFGSVPAWMRK